MMRSPLGGHVMPQSKLGRHRPHGSHWPAAGTVTAVPHCLERRAGRGRRLPGCTGGHGALWPPPARPAEPRFVEDHAAFGGSATSATASAGPAAAAPRRRPRRPRSPAPAPWPGRPARSGRARRATSAPPSGSRSTTPTRKARPSASPSTAIRRPGPRSVRSCSIPADRARPGSTSSPPRWPCCRRHALSSISTWSASIPRAWPAAPRSAVRAARARPVLRPRSRRPSTAAGFDALVAGDQPVRPGLPGPERQPAALRRHRRRGPGHGPDPRGARRRQAHLPRLLVRHPPRRHLRRAVPDPRPGHGPRRRPRPGRGSRSASTWPRPSPSTPSSTPSSPTARRSASCAWKPGGDLRTAFEALMAGLKAQPPAGHRRPHGRARRRPSTAWPSRCTDRADWPDLAAALQRAEQGDGSLLLAVLRPLHRPAPRRHLQQ